jgi:hypothetical protein
MLFRLLFAACLFTVISCFTGPALSPEKCSSKVAMNGAWVPKGFSSAFRSGVEAFSRGGVTDQRLFDEDREMPPFDMDFEQGRPQPMSFNGPMGRGMMGGPMGGPPMGGGPMGGGPMGGGPMGGSPMGGRQSFGQKMTEKAGGPVRGRGPMGGPMGGGMMGPGNPQQGYGQPMGDGMRPRPDLDEQRRGRRSGPPGPMGPMGGPMRGGMMGGPMGGMGGGRGPQGQYNNNPGNGIHAQHLARARAAAAAQQTSNEYAAAVSPLTEADNKLQQRSRPQPQANDYGAGGASAAAEEAAKRAWLDKQDMPPGGQGRGVASQQSYDQYMANKHKEGGLGGGASSSAYRGSVVPSRPPQARGSGYDPSGPPLPKYSDMTRGAPPAPRAAPRPPVERRQRSWLKMASTLFEDSAPSASLDCLKARAASTHPRAQPEPLGGSP